MPLIEKSEKWIFVRRFQFWGEKEASKIINFDKIPFKYDKKSNEEANFNVLSQTRRKIIIKFDKCVASETW